jgi:hypothetical protein
MKSKIFQNSQKMPKLAKKAKKTKKSQKKAKIRLFCQIMAFLSNFGFFYNVGFFGKLWNKLLFVISEATYGLHRSRVHDTK